MLCRELGLLFTASVVAIDGSKFKAVNNRDRNFTPKVKKRQEQIEESIERYLEQLDTADRQEPTEALAARTTPQGQARRGSRQQMQRMDELEGSAGSP